MEIKPYLESALRNSKKEIRKRMKAVLQLHTF